jgi:hypothetical protein
MIDRLTKRIEDSAQDPFPDRNAWRLTGTHDCGPARQSARRRAGDATQMVCGAMHNHFNHNPLIIAGAQNRK